ncbi:MAG TPA: hypothetical protein EYP05_09155 [Piscirickettsiaceae bacterium]|nr:hypothetical protein [Piscirickettsiaceae bacterium]
MPIDLSGVDPLKPKKALLEAAMAQQKANQGVPLKEMMQQTERSEAIPPDLQWLVEDQTALHDLVRQMDASISELARQLRQAQLVMDNGRKQVEAEQKLLYKQIKTLNNLMKKQIETFELVNRKVEKITIAENSILPQLGVGIIGGIVAGITVALTLPWIQWFLGQL